MNHFFHIVSLLLWFLLSEKIFASCCVSGSTGGVSSLLAHERASVEIISGLKYRYGSFNKQSQLTFGHARHLPYLIIENELQLMTRLFYVEPFLRLPMRVQTSELRTRARMADITVGMRLPIIKEEAIRYFPSLNLFAALSLPTGAHNKNQSGLFNEDITGAGNTMILFGFLIEKEIYGINYGLGYGFSADTDCFRHISTKPGALHEPLLTVGYSLDDFGFLSASIAGSFQSPDRINDLPVKESDRRKIMVSLGYSLPLHSHLKIAGVIGSDLPIPYVGKKFNNEIFVRFSMKFGVF